MSNINYYLYLTYNINHIMTLLFVIAGRRWDQRLSGNSRKKQPGRHFALCRWSSLAPCSNSNNTNNTYITCCMYLYINMHCNIHILIIQWSYNWHTHSTICHFPGQEAATRHLERSAERIGAVSWHTYIYIYICIHISLPLSLRTYIYIYIYTHIHIYIYMYI